MDAAIARAPVQICDINSEHPADLFCKKSLNLYFHKRDQQICSEFTSQIWIGARAMAVPFALGAMYGLTLINESGEKWWA